MFEGKNRRRHQRREVSYIKPLQLNSGNGEIFFIVPVDESESGAGCIYSGRKPPVVGHIYRLEENGGSRPVEVRWVTVIGKERFRIGLLYLD